MREVKCDICGKMISMAEAYDEFGHTTKNGFVNIEFRDSREYRGEYDLCVDCIDKILIFAKSLKQQEVNGNEEKRKEGN